MKGIKNKENKGTQKDKLAVVAMGICGIFFCLIIRLGYITLVKGNEYSAEAESDWHSEVSVTAKRGDIVDRNGSILVSSANVYRIDFDLDALRQYVDEEKLDINTIANDIATILEINAQEVLEIINTKTSTGLDATFATLARGVEKAKADKIKELKIYGVLVSDDVKRYYPNGNFLAHALGSINSDGHGLTGVELQYDQYLAGIPGMKIEGVDAATNQMPFVPYKFTPPVDGKNVVLTIDENIQYFVERIAEKGLNQNKAKQVSILVMDPNNGDILAMTNKRDYDPNNPYDGAENFPGSTDEEKLQSMWRNSIISDTFEPGSTFKIVTMIAAMEEGVVKETDTFNCTGGVKFGSHTVHCWKLDGHGVQTLPEILMNSCNPGFMEVGSRLGKVKLNEYIKKLGFGKTTKIDLPGEAEGIIKPNDEISDIDLATIAFGQTNTVTWIQLMTAFNAVANGGDLIQPHIMKEITHEDQSGETVVDEVYQPNIKKKVLSEENTATLRGYLERTATQDGPPNSFVQGYDIGAKSGTAQKVDPVLGGYSADKYIASMVALSPVENPQITVFIAVDEPSTGIYYGGQVAAPLMKELFKDIFSYMDSPIAKERYEISRDIVIPDVRGKSLNEAKSILDENYLDYEIEGKGDTITSIEPYPGSTVKEGTTIKVSTKGKTVDKKVIVPNLKGTSQEYAQSLLDKLGLSCTFEGEGEIYHQSIPKGTLLDKGSTIKLTLKKESEY